MSDDTNIPATISQFATRADFDAHNKELEKNAFAKQCLEPVLNSQNEAFKAELQHWKLNHANIVKRLKIATERPDLPVDRIPAIDEMKKLQNRVAELEQQVADLKESLRYAIETADGFMDEARGTGRKISTKRMDLAMERAK